jgi:hypothetical protein
LAALVDAKEIQYIAGSWNLKKPQSPHVHETEDQTRPNKTKQNKTKQVRTPF